MERCCGVTQEFVSRAFHHVSVSLYRLGAPPRSPRHWRRNSNDRQPVAGLRGRLYDATIVHRHAYHAILNGMNDLLSIYCPNDKFVTFSRSPVYRETKVARKIRYRNVTIAIDWKIIDRRGLVETN